jgi:hypothetical protein
MAQNLELTNFTGEKLEKIFVKYWDLSEYDDDEDVIEDENTEITQIENIAFVFGEKAIIVNYFEAEDNVDELTIEYIKWPQSNDTKWYSAKNNFLSEYIGKSLSYVWECTNIRFRHNPPVDMYGLNFNRQQNIFVYSNVSELEILESHQVPVPPKTS